jgi:alpha-galactosidase
MASFSDAHESLEIPIIAASLHRLMLPRQSQIWAVLHASDTSQRLAYSLTAGFLGRLCISGELEQLDENQWSVVQDAICFYEQIAPIIKNGKSRLHQQIGNAWRHPQGAQAVVRISESGDQALVVAHTFAAPLPEQIIVSLPEGEWQVSNAFPSTEALPVIDSNQLRIKPSVEFEGLVLHITRE